MIIRYMHRGVERWAEAYRLTKMGTVKEILSVPVDGITTVALEDGDEVMIGDYHVPEVGDDIFEGLRDAFFIDRGGFLTPDRVSTSPRLVQFSGTDVEFFVQTRD